MQLASASLLTSDSFRSLRLPADDLGHVHHDLTEEWGWYEIRFLFFRMPRNDDRSDGKVRKSSSHHLNSRSGRDASLSEAHWPYQFRASDREDEWHQRSTATILCESVCDPASCSSSPSAAAAVLGAVAAARARTVPCSSAWAHSCSQPKNRRSNEKTYGYRSVRHSLARGRALCQSGTEHAQVGQVDTLHQQCLVSRIVPITSV